jgi:hypothetical protein
MICKRKSEHRLGIVIGEAEAVIDWYRASDNAARASAVFDMVAGISSRPRCGARSRDSSLGMLAFFPNCLMLAHHHDSLSPAERSARRCAGRVRPRSR